MVIEGRVIAVILIYISTFVGYLLGRELPDKEREELEFKRKCLEIFKRYLNKENKDE